LSWEQAMAELESINDKIERGEIGLEESLAEYRRGVALTKRCQAILDTAEQELKKIKPGGSDEK
jgi:exodeoxyribonuclease VII small subunit